MLTELPAIPTREVSGQTILAPADVFSAKKNVENPELYAIFPYKLYGIGKDTDISQATEAMKHRRNKQVFGWCQNEIQQAYLGQAEDARKGLLARSKMRHKEALRIFLWQMRIFRPDNRIIRIIFTMKTAPSR